MTQNEIEFLQSIRNHLHDVKEAQQYIAGNLGIESTYDEDTVTLHLKANINESLQLASAKKYVDDVLGCVNVVYDFE